MHRCPDCGEWCRCHNDAEDDPDFDVGDCCHECALPPLDAKEHADV